MGVPAFFRWLHRKYPAIVTECIEIFEVEDFSKNPNGVEFDNLYIDMNGIIHPCTHPEDKPAPRTEDEMMMAIFETIDRIFKIVRPRKLFYMAIDGVAPRAKMNQQRSRRFRAAKESEEKAEQIYLLKKKLEAKGIELQKSLMDKPNNFDSNCITPGTEFMARLTKCLNYYIHERIANCNGWKEIKIILSDASVPGEGEHKIMDFIRRQRAHPDHDPNTHHCICGADADLIMLGLATHEPYFTIIREEFVVNTSICLICGKKGHMLVDCEGLSSEIDNINEGKIEKNTTKLIFLRLNVLREYLELELSMPGLPFEYDFERIIDDWVFLCFLVGNDFLPHLPSLEIYEGAIDRLTNLYKKVIPKTNGFVTHNGEVNLDILQVILKELGTSETEIFNKRHSKEMKLKKKERFKVKQENNQSKSPINETLEMEHSGPIDEIKLWEYGYKERYYKSKFNINNDNRECFKIAFEYVRGLCWVLKYYYQGCTSWMWYYPYYYAPFASDFVNITHTNIFFEKGTPFAPLEQLMGVLPSASSELVPRQWADLMKNPLSSIIDFYPKDFIIDLNGKRFAWQGVALLPFIDENRLKKTLCIPNTDLTETEVNLNKCGYDRLYLGMEVDCFKYINNLDSVTCRKKNPLLSDGVYGNIFIINDEFFQGETIPAPFKGANCVKMNSAISVAYSNPEYPEDYVFKSSRLTGTKEPPRVLKMIQPQKYYFPLINEERYIGSNMNDLWNHNHSFTRNSCSTIDMSSASNRASVSNSGHRMLRHAINKSCNHNRNQSTNKSNFNQFHPYRNR